MKSPEMSSAIFVNLTRDLGFDAVLMTGEELDIIHVTDENGKKFEVTITEVSE